MISHKQIVSRSEGCYFYGARNHGILDAGKLHVPKQRANFHQGLGV
jgi:hypothetical protein